VKSSFVLAESEMFTCAEARQAENLTEDRDGLSTPDFKIHHCRAAKIPLQL